MAVAWDFVGKVHSGGTVPPSRVCGATSYNSKRVDVTAGFRHRLLGQGI